MGEERTATDSGGHALNIPTVLLFDIDGTLISTGGAGRKALELAYEALHQRADAITALRLRRDDRPRDRPARSGGDRPPPTEAAIAAVLAKYLEFLAVEVPKIEARKVRRAPGNAGRDRRGQEEWAQRSGWAPATSKTERGSSFSGSGCSRPSGSAASATITSCGPS